MTMVNEEIKEQLRASVLRIEEEIVKLQDLVELGQATGNRNLDAEAQLETSKEQLKTWKTALGMS